MSGIAIVGAGIAGLGLAYYLGNDHDGLTIYEKSDYLGGHANTVVIDEESRAVPIDTGFMVFNHSTYPLLVELFRDLGVPTEKTDMSFSVQHKLSGLEYSGASYNRLFGDRRNIFDLRFWRMLREIDRFNKEGGEAELDYSNATLSLAEFIRTRGYSSDFLNLYLLPMSSAIWSTAPQKMLHFPAITLLRFFKNHGLLGVESQHQWWTVKGGSAEYVRRLRAALNAVTRVSREVVKVERGPRSVSVTTTDGDRAHYDRVVLACHADQALRLLVNPSETEARLLSAFSYQRNNTLLHTDESVMPSQKRCWASWNYRVDGAGATTHYYMNSLQRISDKQNYFVTLNGDHLIDESSVLKRITYHHPVFDKRSLLAQSELQLLNERSPHDQVFYCGSYFGYGFHEDALRSAHQLSGMLKAKILCR